MRSLVVISIVLLCGSLSFSSDAAENKEANAEVAVLASLHGLHEEIRAYDFEALRASILKLEPDVLCMEIDAADLASETGWGSKREYPEVVMPMLDEHGFATCTMEPEPNVAAPLIDEYRKVNAQLKERDPESYARFSAYNEGMYEGLKAYWRSPADVNSELTDRILGAKHELQIELFGPGEEKVWSIWNTHFLESIVAAARAHPGRRVVVIVGVEHGYWLRRELGRFDEFRLLNTASILRKN